jgi:two-component system cell cycle response regulator DivK
MEPKDPLRTGELSGIDPVKEADWARRRNLHTRSGQNSAKKFLILVVDDSADNVAMLSLDLQHQGYKVVTANNGEEAISVALNTLPNLILMDISMPKLDGLGATRKIREKEELRDIPVVAVTAFETEGFQRAAYDVGFSGYLTKPIDFARMHQLVAGLLAPRGSGSLIRP